MRFVDEVKINISSGKGGDGCVGFRREKYIEFGGPDGGDGGDGGNVIFLADDGVNTLVNFRGKKNYCAENGEGGMGRQRHGKYGEDVVIKVPVGTIIRNVETNEVIADLTENGEQTLIAEGGRGGLGNTNFKSSTNQAPRYAQEGKPGVELELELELKLIADIALIGLPNAGKSTLISSISAARPKIADYPFTTLEPNLGVVQIEESSFVVADIPGLIENAAEGKGLGIKFLKHIERTSSFVHLVDCSMCLEPYEAFDSYITIREELKKYSDGLYSKREVICLTKIDAMSEEEIEKFQKFFEEQLDKNVLPISSVSGKNIDELKFIMLQTTKAEEVQ
ncbi:MAG: GTPase ObgE [Bdellovibrionales bacterium]|jgi:GTPase|nr:GTPase ObgE [Bdellovibrionales bacterium]